MRESVDSIVRVPAVIARRAWECAFDLGQEHSETIGNAPLWHWFQHVVTQRDPESLSWQECRRLFALHRLYRPRRQ